MVAQAAHIPVHLGSMPASVAYSIQAFDSCQPGDVIILNDPYRGGSHLPDVTVVTPVHHDQTRELLFFTASRAHHAEIGGIVPGSMPPFSKNLAEEGVLLANLKIAATGESRFDVLREALTAAEDDGGNTAGATQAAARTRTLDVTHFGVEFDGHA